MSNNPRIFIRPAAKIKLDLYILLNDDEISGLGTVTQIGNDFLIEDVFLFKQKGSSGETKLNQKDVALFLLECKKNNIDSSKIKFWFHSHTHSIFWSQKDDNNIDQFKNDYFISIVGNKDGEYLARLDLYSPIRLYVDNLTIRLYIDDEDPLTKQIKEEIKAKVTKIKYKKRKDKFYRYPYFSTEKEEQEALKDYIKNRALLTFTGDLKDVNPVTEEEVDCTSCSTYNCTDCEIWDKISGGSV